MFPHWNTCMSAVFHNRFKNANSTAYFGNAQMTFVVIVCFYKTIHETKIIFFTSYFWLRAFLRPHTSVDFINEESKPLTSQVAILVPNNA